MTGSVRAGQDGWLFETADEVSIPPDGDRLVLTEWARCLCDRQLALADAGAVHLHLTVPDRLTLFGDRVGAVGLDREPALDVARFMREQAGGPPASWVDLGGYLAAQRDKHTLFWKSDSRWSPWAAFMALQIVCARLQVEANTLVLGYPHVETPITGDLANAFGAGGGEIVPEAIRRYRFDRRSRPFYANELARRALAHDADRASLGVSPEAASGAASGASLERFVGARRGFRNDHPQAVRQRVLVFGDRHTALDRSLFGGMLAETFAEVHVVIATHPDPALVSRLRPDVVITQISERRMYTPPGASAPLAELASRSLAVLRGDPERTDERPADTYRTRSSVLLAPETYRLDPPITVQSECVDDINDEVMISNPVVLHDVPAARVYFDGPRHLISDARGAAVSRFDVDAEREVAIRRSPHRRLRGTTLVFATSAGAHCYYHWMLELLPKFGLLERAGIPVASIDHVMVRELVGRWQLETLARCGVPRSKLVLTRDAPWYECERALHIDHNGGINLKMHRFVPQWMKHLYPVDASGAERLRLYISRPPGVRRGITNEAAMLPLLERHGFEAIAMEGRTVAEQAALLARADIVMSPHGGALTNMVFCRPGTRVVELLSRHVYPYYYGLAATCGHRYHAILEAPHEDYGRLVNHDLAQSFAAPRFQHATHARSFDVPLEALRRLLERLDEGECRGEASPRARVRPFDAARSILSARSRGG